MKITAITSTTLRVDGRQVTHRDMMLACIHEDAATAAAYRRIVSDHVIPAVRRAHDAAYGDYCGSSVVHGGSIAGGHGSMSMGPDARRQDRYIMLDDLRQSYVRAARGAAVESIPMSRSESPCRPWEVATADA